MMHCLLKTVALVCPREKLISFPKSDLQTTLLVLKSLQLPLDHILQQAYTRKSPDFVDKKINPDETIHHPSRLTR
ncbi:MAG: hypothetical protein K0R24_2151 [Gammaproteobacteria bacterium]|jgi:hypothetical protein|nr:hypothetical protein [Gammaproteobacteria bacterium]